VNFKNIGNCCITSENLTRMYKKTSGTTLTSGNDTDSIQIVQPWLSIHSIQPNVMEGIFNLHKSCANLLGYVQSMRLSREIPQCIDSVNVRNL